MSRCSRCGLPAAVIEHRRLLCGECFLDLTLRSAASRGAGELVVEAPPERDNVVLAAPRFGLEKRVEARGGDDALRAVKQR